MLSGLFCTFASFSLARASDRNRKSGEVRPATAAPAIAACARKRRRLKNSALSDRKSTRLNSSQIPLFRMPSSALKEKKKPSKHNNTHHHTISIHVTTQQNRT